MGKDILAFFGLVFLTLVIVICVAVIGLLYDDMGIITLPPGLVETPMSYLTTLPETVRSRDSEIKITNGSGSEAEWTNPLELLPTETPSPVPVPTETPVPPLDPAVYRSEVIVRLKSFAAALEQWLDANRRLSMDNSLKDDPAWREQMSAILQNVRITGQSLANVGPAPDEFLAIDGWLVKVGEEAAGLQWNYDQAMANDDNQYYVAAGENFKQIKEDLTQATQLMVLAGWTFE